MKTGVKSLAGIVAWLIIIQAVLLSIKQIVFCSAEETLFSRSMLTMLCMAAITAAMILYCRRNGQSLSVFPKVFTAPYIIFSFFAAGFMGYTLVAVNGGSLQKVLMLLYASFVTPIFEELLFRGLIWNRLNTIFRKEWQTYLTVTLLFALWHIGYAVGLYLWSGGDLMNVIVMKVLVGGAFGLLTGGLRYLTKNCYCGIVVHGILNAIG